MYTGCKTLLAARACKQFCTPASAVSAVPSANWTPASASAADALAGNGTAALCPAGGRMAVGAKGSHVVRCGSCTIQQMLGETRALDERLQQQSMH